MKYVLACILSLLFCGSVLASSFDSMDIYSGKTKYSFGSMNGQNYSSTSIDVGNTTYTYGNIGSTGFDATTIRQGNTSYTFGNCYGNECRNSNYGGCSGYGGYGSGYSYKSVLDY